MDKPRTTIADQLNAAQLAVTNSLADPEIKSRVAAYGYTAEKLLEGRALFDAARAAVSAQESAAGAQQAATQTLAAAKAEAHDAYQSLAKVARAVSDPASLAGLGLTGLMPAATAAFLTAAGTLFDNAGALPALAQYGYDSTKLAAERARVEACAAADRAQEAAKGAAQQATRDQDAALRALNKWMAQYVKIARVALRETPQLLVNLGVSA